MTVEQRERSPPSRVPTGSIRQRRLQAGIAMLLCGTGLCAPMPMKAADTPVDDLADKSQPTQASRTQSPRPISGDAQSADTPPVGAVVTNGNVTIYRPAFFAVSRPDTALDMVKLIPGFVIESDGAARGLGDTTGNVLIDRARPAKTSSIAAELTRIPAGSVAAILIYRGVQSGIDLGGYAQVVDVIRKRGTASRGSAALGMGIGGNGGVTRSLSIEASRGAGRGRQALSGNLSRIASEVSSTRTRSISAGTQLSEAASTTSHSRSSSIAPSADIPFGSYTIAAISASRTRSAGASREGWSGDASGIPPAVYTTEARLRRTRGTLDLRHAPPGALRLGATFSYSDMSNANVASAGTGTDFKSDTVTRERAGRVTAAWTPTRAVTLEGGVDYAFNALDALTALTGPAGPIPLPNSDLGVSEKRLGGYATLNWSAGPASAIARLRVDRAILIASGGRTGRRDLLDVRPRLQFGYAVGDRTRLDLSVAREVEQLPFNLFAASAKLSDGTVNAGAGEIDPEHSWAAEASLQHGFWDKGSVTLSARGEAIDNPIGLVVTPEGYDATGNLGSAWRLTLSAQLSLPLDRLGLGGARLDVQQTRVTSHVADPVTGKDRPLDNDLSWTRSIALRQDLPGKPLSWGLSIQQSSALTSYRLAEVQRLATDRLFNLFLEVKPRPSLSLRAEANWGGDSGSFREIHAGRRDLAPLLAIEQRTIGGEARGLVTLRVAT